MLRPLVVVLATLAAVAGCSGDDSPDEAVPEQVSEGLAALFAGDHAADEDAPAATCFADELAARVTLAQLREAGVVGDDDRVVADVPPLPADLAHDWAAAQLACTDFVEESTDAQVRISKGRLDADAYAACLREALPEEALRAAVAASLAGRWDSAELADLADAQGSCRRAATPPDE